MENKINSLAIIIIAVVSVIATIVIANLLLDTRGKVNQGNIRVSDIVIESTAKLKEVQDKDTTIKNLSDFVFDITQTNNLNILLEVNQEISEIGIENLKIDGPELKGSIMFGQKDYELVELTEEPLNIPLKTEKQGDNYIISLVINNENVLTDKSVDDSVEEIQYDAKIFNILGVDINQLKFTLSFDLCVKDVNGKISRTAISLNMPTDETIVKGMSILRQDASQFIFTVLN